MADTAPDLPDLSGATILAVDDSDDALYVVQTFLQHCGAVVLVARNAFGALAYLETTRVDLIISDISMPQMDGMELIERIRKAPNHRHTPAIALTAFPENYPALRFAGFDAVMHKPIDLDRLCRKVAELVPPRRPNGSTSSDAR